MKGDVLFEALNGIDDDLIEKAVQYRPHAGFQWRMLSGAAAAVLILAVGAFAWNTFGGVGVLPSGSTASDEMCVAAGTQQNSAAAAQDAAEEAAQETFVEEYRNTADKDMAADAAESAVTSEEGIYRTVGELDGYEIKVRVLLEDEYLIYVTKDGVTKLLSESLIDSGTREQIILMTQEYLEKEAGQ